MKSLKNFEAIVSALHNINTPTKGISFRCSIYDIEQPRSAELTKAKAELFGLQRKGTPEQLKAKIDEINKIQSDPNERTIVFKLEDIISSFTGTKEYKLGDQIKTYTMHNIEFVYCKAKYINMDVLSYEETGEKTTNRQGDEVDIINLELSSCVLEVDKPQFNYKGDVSLPERATIEIMTKKDMQVIGRMSSYANANNSKLRGIFTDAELGL